MPEHDPGVSYELRQACDRLNQAREQLKEVKQKIDNKRRRITSQLLDERDVWVEIIRVIEDKYPVLKGRVNARLKQCWACKGAGEVEERKECDSCHGRGHFYSGGGVPADSTWGSDFVPATKENCHSCGGSGWVREKHKKICRRCGGHKVIVPDEYGC